MMILFKLNQSVTSFPEQRSESLYFVPYVSESTELRESHAPAVTCDGFSNYVSNVSLELAGRDLSCIDRSVGLGGRENGFYSHFGQGYISGVEDSSISKDSDAREAKELICSWEKNGEGKLASFYAVFFVETGFKHREYKKINQLLSDVDVDDVTEWSIVALLRSSFFARSYFPAWGRLLSAATEKLEKEGKDAHRILRGLNR